MGEGGGYWVFIRLWDATRVDVICCSVDRNVQVGDFSFALRS